MGRGTETWRQEESLLTVSQLVFVLFHSLPCPCYFVLFKENNYKKIFRRKEHPLHFLLWAQVFRELKRQRFLRSMSHTGDLAEFPMAFQVWAPVPREAPLLVSGIS